MGSRPSNVVFMRRSRRRWTRTGGYLAGNFARSKRHPAKQQDRWFGPALVAMPLGACMAAFLWSGPPPANAVQQAGLPADRERASFSLCGGFVRSNCVIDGDTIWYRSEKIRIADINTPEVSEPDCAREAALGRRATLRLQALLNRGPFTLVPNPDGRPEDKYGRSLFVITRVGESLGGELVAEGLAEYWRGYRGNWC